MKEEYLKMLGRLKKQIKNSKKCEEQKILLLIVDSYIKTIKSEDVSEEDLIKHLKGFI